ncbi:MAG: SLBB domain-containing protein [Candidatus Riflebacteria bacterium]|nr:SLBB domain-containing protein [Candidatus Riflebacteria bacterium]
MTPRRPPNRLPKRRSRPYPTSRSRIRWSDRCPSSDFNSKKVYLIGDGKSGVLPLTGETMTLFDVIAAAGGLAPTSDKKHLIVIRGNKKFVVNYQEELLKPGGISDRFIVQPGDRIIVPRPLYKVTILGGVNKAGDLDWDESMTLLRAIAQAGSFNDNARKDRIKIIRKSVDTKSAAQGKREQTISVNVDKIFQGKVQDISLRPGDTIYVTEW